MRGEAIANSKVYGLTRSVGAQNRLAYWRTLGNRRHNQTMNRRTFMFLLFVTALCKLPKSATAAPTCRECGRTIWRGSRASRLDALPPMPEAELCLQCLAALPGDEYDLIL